jgi:hypothetical protein
MAWLSKSDGFYFWLAIEAAGLDDLQLADAEDLIE